MRIYSEASQEAVRSRYFLKDWRVEGLVTPEQYTRMEQETACELRRTNVFLRAVLFLFTLMIVGAGAGLFFSVFLSNPGEKAVGVLLLIFAALSYAAAEVAVSQARLYRYGIEEALACCSVGFLCAGLQLAFFGDVFSKTASFVPAAGAAAALWIWHRFGFAYLFFAAMALAVWMTAAWSSVPLTQHVALAGLYGAGLAAVAAVRPRYRFTYLDGEYSIAEALLWLGIYLALNLQISAVGLSEAAIRSWGGYYASGQFPNPFYWTTWVLIWLLPAVVLARGLRRKDRWVIAIGAGCAVLTLVTNKPYLGWPRHTWDPILLGLLLTGLAVIVRRWLAAPPEGIRNGFTAQRLSGRDKTWMNIGMTAVGLAAPDAIVPHPPAASPEVKFGGGSSGGGGASSDF